MAGEIGKPVSHPPRWFITNAWKVHRLLYRVTGGRKFLWTPSNKRGWGEGEPAWWLNLMASPETTVQLADAEPRRVAAHAAEGPERDRLWGSWRAVEPKLDEYAALRSTQTAVVVLTPASDG